MRCKEWKKSEEKKKSQSIIKHNPKILLKTEVVKFHPKTRSQSCNLDLFWENQCIFKLCCGKEMVNFIITVYLGGQSLILQARVIGGGLLELSHSVSLTACFVSTCRHIAMASCVPGLKRKTLMKHWRQTRFL